MNPGARIELRVKTPDDGSVASSNAISDGLRALVRADRVVFGPDAVPRKRAARATPVGEYEVIVPLAGVADLEAEIARLRKEKRAIEGELAGVDEKLSNQDFLAKAKEDVVQKSAREGGYAREPNWPRSTSRSGSSGKTRESGHEERRLRALRWASFSGARASRESLTLADVHQETKMSIPVLRALEQDDFGSFESEIYLKGFLKTLRQVSRARRRTGRRKAGRTARGATVAPGGRDVGHRGIDQGREGSNRRGFSRASSCRCSARHHRRPVRPPRARAPQGPGAAKQFPAASGQTTEAVESGPRVIPARRPWTDSSSIPAILRPAISRRRSTTLVDGIRRGRGTTFCSA